MKFVGKLPKLGSLLPNKNIYPLHTFVFYQKLFCLNFFSIDITCKKILTFKITLQNDSSNKKAWNFLIFSLSFHPFPRRFEHFFYQFIFQVNLELILLPPVFHFWNHRQQDQSENHFNLLDWNCDKFVFILLCKFLPWSLESFSRMQVTNEWRTDKKKVFVCLVSRVN